MFGKMGDMAKMMGQLKESQAKMEQKQKEMDEQSMQFQSDDGNIVVVMSISGKVLDMKFDLSHYQGDTDTFRHQLTQTLNTAQQKCKAVYDTEMQGIAKSLLPNIPGM